MKDQRSSSKQDTKVEADDDDQRIACEVDIVYGFGSKADSSLGVIEASSSSPSVSLFTQTSKISLKHIMPELIPQKNTDNESTVALNPEEIKAEYVPTDLHVISPPYGICGTKVQFVVEIQQPTVSDMHTTMKGRNDDTNDMVQHGAIVECTAQHQDWMETGKSSRRVFAIQHGGPATTTFELMPLREGHLKMPFFTQRPAIRDAQVTAKSRNSTIAIAPSGHFSTTAFVVTDESK
jgi:hypothetical protein